jgi:hypothetical protein
MKSIKDKILLTVIILDLILGPYQILSDATTIENDNASFKDSGIITIVDEPLRSDDSVIDIQEESNAIGDTQTITVSPLTQEDLSFLEKEITFNGTSTLEYVSNLEVSYPYEELYTKPYTLDNLDTAKDANNIISGNVVDEEKLLATVLDNNQKYMAKYNVNTYAGTTVEFVKNICHTIKEMLDSSLKENNDIDINLLNTKLNDLKIFSFTGYAYGLYNSENGILGINETMLANKTIDFITDTIYHEIVHLIQSVNGYFLENSTYDDILGYTYKEKDNNSINPYHWTWFTEAAAEAIANKYNNLNSPYVYSAEIGSLESMKLAMFDTSVSLESTLLTNDIANLYKYFNATTKEEQTEINKMFYAYTIIYNYSPGEEGINFYKVLKEMGVDIDNNAHLETNLKGSISLTQTKLFYKNLINRIQGKNVSLKDIFTTIKVFELEISKNVWYQSKYADLEYFLESYTTIQEMFFSELSVSLNVDETFIKELYVNFNSMDFTDIDVSFLSDTENNYLNYIVSTRTGNKKDAILKVYSDNYVLGVNSLINS